MIYLTILTINIVNYLERSFASPEILLFVGFHGLLRIKFTS